MSTVAARPVPQRRGPRAWLGVPDGQAAKTIRLVGLIAALSAALVLMKAAQSGIFLSAYPQTAIPRAFLVSALVLAGMSSAQVALMPRTGPLSMAALTQAGGAAGLLAFFAALLSGYEQVSFALYVFIEALCGLLIIQVWTVTSGALDPRAAKRILPLCGMASSLAWVVGGVMVGPLSATLGARGLLLVAAGFLVGGAALVLLVARLDYRGREVRRRRPGGLLDSWLSGLSFVRRVPLMRIAAALGVLALCTEQLMDFALMSAAQDRYSAPEALSAFFGRFFGATSAVSLVILVVGSSRILQTLGASRALLAMPGAVVLGGTAVAAAALSAAPAFFPLVVMRGAARVLKQSLWGTSLEQTQTPLPVLQRSQARALVRGVLAPLGYAGLAAGLTALPAHTPPAWLAGGAAGCGFVMLGVILARMRPAYRDALQRTLDARRLDLDRLPGRGPGALDKDTLDVVARELESEDPGRAGLAVDVIDHSAPAGAVSLLEQAAAHPAPQVRRAAVSALTRAAERAHAEGQDAEPAVALVRARLLSDEEAAVRVLAARALRALPWSAETEAAVTSATLDDDAEVRALGRVARFERRPDRAGPEGQAALLRLLDDEACRDIALTAVSEAEAERPEVKDRLRALLDDDDAQARTAALRCVRRLKLLPLLPEAVALLEDPRCAQVAATELASWGDEVTALLARIARFEGGESEGSFYKMARARWAERAYPVLVRLLGHRERSVRLGAGRVLCGLVGVGSVEPLLRLEVERIFHCYGILAGLAFTDGTPDWKIDGAHAALGDEIELHIRFARDRLLQLLYLLDEERLIRAVEVGLRRPTPRLAAQVAELLELSLEPPLARRIVPLFDSLSLPERVDAARRIRALDERALVDPLPAVVDLGDPHLRRFAMLVYGEAFKERFPRHWEQDEALLALYDRMRFLRSAPLFADLGGDDLRSVAEIVEPVDYEAEEVIFEEGDPGDNLFLVVTGAVDVLKDGHRVATLRERDVLGELAVLDQEPRSADAVVHEPARLLRLRAADLQELIARRPQINSAIVQVLARRLRASLQRIEG